MQPDQQVIFDRYTVDLHNAQLWRGKRAIPLTSQTFAVLLVDRTSAPPWSDADEVGEGYKGDSDHDQ